MIQVGTNQRFGVPQRIGYKNAFSVLIVDERAEFIAETEIKLEVRPHPIRILNIETKESLSPGLAVIGAGQNAV